MTIRNAALTCVVLFGGIVPASAQVTPQNRQVSAVVYPILFQTPIFGATVDVPPVPGGGEGEITGSGTTDTSLNALYMGGVEVEAYRAFGEVDFLWTKPSASHTAPRVDVASEIWLVSGKAGYRFFKDLGVTGGFRRLSLDLNTTLELPSFGTTLNGQTSQALWDPFIGMEWRRHRNTKLWTTLAAEFGGFGTALDSDITLRGRVDWQVIRHLALRAGYEMLHFSATLEATRVNALERTLSTTQTLHGPEFGVGIVF